MPISLGDLKLGCFLLPGVVLFCGIDFVTQVCVLRQCGSGVVYVVAVYFFFFFLVALYDRLCFPTYLVRSFCSRCVVSV